MKPISQNSRFSSWSERSFTSPRRARAPLTDYNYQTTLQDAYAGAAVVETSSASRDESRPAMASMFALWEQAVRREFRAEAIAFGVLIALTSWPVASLVHVLRMTV